MASDEQTPLLSQDRIIKDLAPKKNALLADDSIKGNKSTSIVRCRRQEIHEFLETNSVYEMFMILLIFLSVVSFVFGTLFDPEYSRNNYAGIHGVCGSVCDGLFFGNYSNNFLKVLGLGPTSVLEIVTVFIFTLDYLLRLSVADLEDDRYSGILGRLWYLPSFYSLVDLAAVVPFYVDVALVNTNLASSQFLRMFRIFRMMKVEGRAYSTALTLFDDVFYQQRAILATALFVGITTWIAVSSLYYLAERRNTDMIYCGGNALCDAVDTSLCTFNSWGIVDCTAAGCPPTVTVQEPCYNMYRSILSASYYSLLNLFGEFPLIGQHSPFGKLVGTVVAVIAVAVFSLPAGIIANGFEQLLEQRRYKDKDLETTNHLAQEALLQEKQSDPQMYTASCDTLRGHFYNFFHVSTSNAAKLYCNLLNVLVIGTSLTFILSTSNFPFLTASVLRGFDIFEILSSIVFTLDYLGKIYCITENPYYSTSIHGRFMYAKRFLSVVDLLSFAPFWIATCFSAQKSSFVKFMRLLRWFRFERYTKAFTTFDDVVRLNYDLFVVTGFAAFILWIFFSAIMYLAERGNPDDDTAMYYSTVPQAMWVTLLNLSGESPLCNYTILGKFTTGILGLFASGLFGIPIGIIGSGFEEIVIDEESESRDFEVLDEQEMKNRTIQAPPSFLSTTSSSQTIAYRFVNGVGSPAAVHFETLIYFLIILTVGIGVLQTVQGYENTLYVFEWAAVFIFTVEYMLRFYGAPEDPELKSNHPFASPWKIRLFFLFSFYSIVDLLAILPMYLAYFMPGSWVDKHDEYLRMLRLIRLVKLDKYYPSITLIDDVLRLKRAPLIVTGYAAGTLWIVFSGLLYLAEYKDTINDIDNVPIYGCDSDCTMSDRFKSYLDSMVYTCIHLTGDYPIITYSLSARCICFFMVIAAVSVVSVFSAIIATGFKQIAQSRSKAKCSNGSLLASNDSCDDEDWYEQQLKLLKSNNTGPPPSRFGSVVDYWQIQVNELLNGKEDPDTGAVTWTSFSFSIRIFRLLVIIANVVAVVLETIPEIDRKVGNQTGNLFDMFEEFSVFVFSTEYAMRLFSAKKNRNSLYSPLVYATTFFGIVDLLSTAPWFIEQILFKANVITNGSDVANVFRLFRIFRILQVEDFIVAFSKLDNVFRASKDVLKATGLMAIIIWVGCGALFFIFEQNNPNWRECDESIPLRGNISSSELGCYDFESIAACNNYYGEGMCRQTAFANMPDALFYTAVFLGGEWGVVDFTFMGRLVCVFLCVAGIALYAIPVGSFIDSFGAVLGLSNDD